MDALNLLVDALAVATSSTATLLRKQIREHNFSVLAASGATFVFAVFGWAVFYGFAYWVTMFVLTVIKAGDASLPASFNEVVATLFATLMLAAAFDAWIFPNERLVDERPALKTVADIILFLPRVTVAIALNFTAWARLARHSRPEAAALLDRLREEKKIAITTLPLDLPNDRQRDRILRVLQIVNIVEVRPERGQLWLRFSPFAPAALRGPLIPDHADDDLSGMRRATVFENKYALPSPKRQLPGHDGNHL